MWKATIRPALLTMAFLSAASLPAFAEILLYSERASAQSWLGGSRGVKLSGNGALTLLFTNPSKGVVSVTFTAECKFLSTSPIGTLGVNIIIDEDVVPVTDGGAVLCAGQGSGIVRGLSMRSITVAADLDAGDHLLRVDALGGAVDEEARLDDITVLVTR